ncbi:MAG TPA: hypothetical protein VF069_04545 [Streptosporangiaceae bacterium]
MSFVTWLALPVVVTLIASLIMLMVSRPSRTDTHDDIESFARFRGALARNATMSPWTAAEPERPRAEPASRDR